MRNDTIRRRGTFGLCTFGRQYWRRTLPAKLYRRWYSWVEMVLHSFNVRSSRFIRLSIGIGSHFSPLWAVHLRYLGIIVKPIHYHCSLALLRHKNEDVWITPQLLYCLHLIQRERFFEETILDGRIPTVQFLALSATILLTSFWRGSSRWLLLTTKWVAPWV